MAGQQQGVYAPSCRPKSLRLLAWSVNEPMLLRRRNAYLKRGLRDV